MDAEPEPDDCDSNRGVTPVAYRMHHSKLQHTWQQTGCRSVCYSGPTPLFAGIGGFIPPGPILITCTAGSTPHDFTTCTAQAVPRPEHRMSSARRAHELVAKLSADVR